MEQQKLNTRTIVEKILDEEKNMERKKQLYPELYNISRDIKMPKTKGKKSFKTLKKIAETLGYNETEVS